MNDKETSIEILFEKAANYSKTSLELFKLNAIDKSADIVSSLVTLAVLAIIVSLFTLIINIGIALWIGELLGKPFYGFFVVAFFYAIIGILIFIFRDQWIKYPVNNSIIIKMLKHKQE
jgi:hypothetical protein